MVDFDDMSSSSDDDSTTQEMQRLRDKLVGLRRNMERQNEEIDQQINANESCGSPHQGSSPKVKENDVPFDSSTSNKSSPSSSGSSVDGTPTKERRDPSTLSLALREYVPINRLRESDVNQAEDGKEVRMGRMRPDNSITDGPAERPRVSPASPNQDCLPTSKKVRSSIPLTSQEYGNRGRARVTVGNPYRNASTATARSHQNDEAVSIPDGISKGLLFTQSKRQEIEAREQPKVVVKNPYKSSSAPSLHRTTTSSPATSHKRSDASSDDSSDDSSTPSSSSNSSSSTSSGSSSSSSSSSSSESVISKDKKTCLVNSDQTQHVEDVSSQIMPSKPQAANFDTNGTNGTQPISVKALFPTTPDPTKNPYKINERIGTATGTSIQTISQDLTSAIQNVSRVLVAQNRPSQIPADNDSDDDFFAFFDEELLEASLERCDGKATSSHFFKPKENEARPEPSGRALTSKSNAVASHRTHYQELKRVESGPTHPIAKNSDMPLVGTVNVSRQSQIDSSMSSARNDDRFAVVSQEKQPSTKAAPEVQKAFKSFTVENEKHQNDTMAEVHHSLYAPPPYKEKPPPVVHKFTLQNRPPQMRRKIPIADLFSLPVKLLWNKYDTFNSVQSEMANLLCHSDDNVVVSAPTGAGKTAVFEMAMARFLVNDLQLHNPGQKSMGPQRVSMNRKIVYIAPSKALCEERYDDWKERLSRLHLGIEVAMVTGDCEPGESYYDVASAHLILSTPEKWDILTRKWTGNFFLLASVKLLLIDEVHLLGDISRGCCLEATIARMKSVQRAARAINISRDDLHTSSYPSTTPQAIASVMRVVAVSATLPNILDIATFFDANEAYSFDDSYRPVPLTTHVSGFGKIWKNQFGFWKSLDKEVRGVINHFSQDNKQTLIFCHTKNETQTLACYLLSKSSSTKPALLSLRECLAQGIAFHHAGLEASERKLVEQQFAAGRLRILCATSTLAVGVNLPAQLVIVKGTMTWRGGSAGYQEIDAAMLLQMIGRAGRPGLDTSGTAVIMTDNDSKERIRMLASGLGAAESQLEGKLADVVNTEISQRVITSLDTALNWIKTTLLFACLKNNPKQFGVQIVSQHSIDSHLLQLCQSAIRQLQEASLVEVNDDHEVFPLPASHIMSQAMIPFDAIKLFTTLSFDASQKDILSVLSQVEDLCAFSLRRDEKKLLNELHETEKIRHKLGIPASKFRLKTPKDKAFILLQASIGQHHFTSYSLKQEMSTLANNAGRFLSAVEAFSIKGSKNGHVAFQSLKLRRSLARSLWGSSSGVLNQIDEVGQALAAKLVFNGIVSFEDVLSSSEEKIEQATGRPKPFGKRIQDAVGALLNGKLETSATIEYTRGSNIPVEVVCEVNYCAGVKASSVTKETKMNYTLLAYTDRPNGCLFYEENITGPGLYRFNCPPTFGKICIRFVANYVGMDQTHELKGNDTIHKSSFAGFPAAKIRNVTTSQPRNVRNSIQSKLVIGPKAQRPSRAKTAIRNFEAASPSVLAAAKAIKPSTRKVQATQDETSPQGTVTPSPKPVINNAASAFSGAMRTPPTPPQFEPSVQPPRFAGIATSGIAPVQQPSVHPVTNYTTAMVEISKPPNQSFRTSSNYGSQYNENFSTNRSRCPIAPSSTESRRKRGSDGNASWNQAKRKQQKSQQRAFARKKDNPFAFYQHDPNDAESHLDALSSDNKGTGSILPTQELDAMRRKSVSYHRPRITDGRRAVTEQASQKRRRNFSPYGKVSNQELLRMKAAEQEAYSGISAEGVYGSESNHLRQSESWNHHQTQHRDYGEARYASQPGLYAHEGASESQMSPYGHSFYDERIEPSTSRAGQFFIPWTNESDRAYDDTSWNRGHDSGYQPPLDHTSPDSYAQACIPEPSQVNQELWTKYGMMESPTMAGTQAWLQQDDQATAGIQQPTARIASHFHANPEYIYQHATMAEEEKDFNGAFF